MVGLLEALGRTVFDFGDDPCAANIAKVNFNFLIVTAVEAMAEAFSVVEKSGLDPVAFDFVNLTDVDVDIAADCSNNPGPYITLTGELSIEGITAVVSFQNSRKNPPHRRDEVVDVGITILEAGENIRFAKQPPLGGVGGNPRIYLQFVDGEGSALSGEIYLGRCVQLSK